MTKLANKAAIEGVEDMHRGLHLAMEELIRRQDYRRTEEILRKLDQVMAGWIDTTKEVR